MGMVFFNTFLSVNLFNVILFWTDPLLDGTESNYFLVLHLV